MTTNIIKHFFIILLIIFISCDKREANVQKIAIEDKYIVIPEKESWDLYVLSLKKICENYIIYRNVFIEINYKIPSSEFLEYLNAASQNWTNKLFFYSFDSPKNINNDRLIFFKTNQLSTERKCLRYELMLGNKVRLRNACYFIIKDGEWQLEKITREREY